MPGRLARFPLSAATPARRRELQRIAPLSDDVAIRTLREAIGLTASEAAFLAACDDDDVRLLLDLFEQERERQAHELQEAIEGGLGALPRMLRKAVARVIVGFG